MSMIIHEDPVVQVKVMAALASKADRVIISTFGIWAGIMRDGQNIHDWNKPNFVSHAQKFLDNCPKNTTILVGNPELKECRLDCDFCKVEYRRRIERVNAHKTHWPQFNWKLATEVHMKSVCMEVEGAWVAFIGGRNLTDSGWADLGFQVDGPDAELIMKATVRQMDSVT